MKRWKSLILVYGVILVISLFTMFFNINIEFNNFHRFLSDLITVISVLLGFLGVFFGIIGAISKDSKIGKVLRTDKIIKKQLIVSMVLPFIIGLVALIVFPFIKINQGFSALTIKTVLFLYSLFLLLFCALGYITVKIFYYDIPDKNDKTIKVSGDSFK